MAIDVNARNGQIDTKYCLECGSQILRKAEICVHCGCHQPEQTDLEPFPQSSVAARRYSSHRWTKVAELLLGNLFWPGLGNILVGDKAG